MTPKSYKDLLDAAARRHVPDNTNFMPRIAARLERRPSMKLRIIRRPLAAILLAIVVLLAGSGVVYANGYLNNAQFWTTNLGKIIIFQNDNRITMLIDGYGSWWHAPIDGVLDENEAVFMDNPLLGEFTLVFNDPTFETKHQDDLIQSGDPDWQLSFCGIRSNVTDELPAGCGFSGKWILAPHDEFPEGSYLVMKQVAGTVTGSFYDNKDKVFDTITGDVYWGKGWRLLGKTEKRGEVTLDINPAGTGIGIIYGEMVPNGICAVREGYQKARLPYLLCEP
jgi:hypothetical protein